MKVTMPINWETLLSAGEYKNAKSIIKECRGDGNTAKDWAEYAGNELAKELGGVCSKIFEASAEISPCKEFGAFDVQYGYLNVIINFTAYISRSWEDNLIVEAGAYLSDIWQTGVTPYSPWCYRKFVQTDV